ncbi:MAG: 5-(carboxyamino)imidazole ribonucleotide synthase [Pirellulaceae bacterium]|nr:5-(carboxyamino)imidazole ribonucleotide synthase [Pirellulaceae bacterium]
MSDRGSNIEKNSSIQPGNWLGVFGGGQLGRMFTHAAQRLGYHVAVWEPESNCPAAQAADRHLQPSSPDEETTAAKELGNLCAAITIEFENINSAHLRTAALTSRVCPGAEFLEICQDRVLEKSSLSKAGFPTTPFLPVQNQSHVAQAIEAFGSPVVLKTARSGYDGKGQAVVRSLEAIRATFDSLDSDHLIAEKWIPYQAEVSMIAARNASGQIECYPLVENEHANHILDVSRCPVQPKLIDLQDHATEICRGIASKFEVVGLFCVEFFVDSQGDLLINEIAPRPHNSGHLTIEAFDCSQFEQQVRAMCNLPLARPVQLRPAAMSNLLGDVWSNGEPDWQAALVQPSVHLHLYGKSQARAGRKMGHLTVLDDDAAHAAAKSRAIRQQLSHT